MTNLRFAVLQAEHVFKHYLSAATKVILALTALLTFALLLYRGTSVNSAVGIALAVSCGAMLVIWWFCFVHNSLKQNTPMHAHLIPGLRRRIVSSVVGWWVAISIACALAAQMVTGQSAIAGTVLMVVAALLIVLAFLQIPRWGMTVASCAWPVTQLLKYLWAGMVSRFGFTVPQPPASVVIAATLALILAAGWLTMYRLFLRTGDRHYADAGILLRKPSLGSAVSEVAPAQPVYERRGILRMLTQPVEYDAAFTAGRLAHTHFGNKILLALGPQLHPSYMLALMVAVAVAVALAVPSIGAAIHAASTRDSIIGALCNALVAIPVVQFVALTHRQLVRTTYEQSLMRLVPAAPMVGEFNRTVYHAMIKRFLLIWLIGFATLIIALAALDLLATAQAFVAFAGAQLPVAAVLLSNYAKVPRVSRVGVTWGVAAMVLLAWVAFFFLGSAKSYASWALFPLAMCALGTAVMFWRARQVSGLPIIFPVARLK